MTPFQLELDWSVPRPDETQFLDVAGRRVAITYSRNPRARRYRLFVDRHGLPRVTIPRRGNRHDAERFMRQHRAWLIREMGRMASERTTNPWWREGGIFLFRGEMIRLEAAGLDRVPHLRLGAELLAAPPSARDADTALRAWVEGHLRRVAGIELPRRVLELADRHESPVRRITVRNQRSRWGSCSRRGTISLNWRLVQSPITVCDYVIVHELMHLREMNHSPRFWKLVAEACPGYRAAEAWLRQHGRALC